MPYTYMPFLLCGLSDEAVDSYIVEVPGQDRGGQEADWVMYVGETYRLPLSGTGLFTWKSSDESVASLNEKGMLSGKKPGDTLLTVVGPGGKQAVIRVRVQDV